jgi:hypothetical protein
MAKAISGCVPRQAHMNEPIVLWYGASRMIVNSWAEASDWAEENFMCVSIGVDAGLESSRL